MTAAAREVVLNPWDPEALYGLAAPLLLDGDFAAGWKAYDNRLHARGYAPPRTPAGLTPWRGGPQDGKRLLIQCEQGLGDTLHFIRYAAAIPPDRRVIEAPKRLHRLLRPALGGAWIDPADPVPEDCGWRIPLMSLPRVFGTRLDTVPPPLGLVPEPDRVAAWRQALGLGPGRAGVAVGIAWQGTPGRFTDRGRSPPLRRYAPLAAVPGIRLIALQKGWGLEQVPHLPPGMAIEMPGPGFDDGPDAFIDTAAIMASLDLVITSDTAIAHLTGSLGRPTWVALKASPDWRWLRDRDDSPWYPTMRLFRQPSPGNWAGVFAAMSAALHGFALGCRPGVGPVGPTPGR